jgi:hypothetical protein
LVNGVTWKDYVVLRDVLDTPGLRMTYCEGALELMSPSRRHELNKKSIARLVELYAFLEELPLVGYGSTTFRNEAKERGVEPDECYRVGTLMRDGEIPDIALEVIHTSPLLDKLHVYSGLGVPETPAPPRERIGRVFSSECLAGAVNRLARERYCHTRQRTCSCVVLMEARSRPLRDDSRCAGL